MLLTTLIADTRKAVADDTANAQAVTRTLAPAD